MASQGTLNIQQDGSLTERIIGAISEHEDVDPLEITPPLYDVIDLDAAEALLTDPSKHGTRDRVQLTFSYNGYTITVEGDDIQIQDN